ncbi:ABC transporter permease [Massilia glaciei]|uniref:ABC transporter permease n=1 Tax=Massilia glaciei TaxID=1524097 RepID=A0A2U2HHB7_9BURK|nr:FtsX-like permease family protein [Massilia glaciei]PWF45065.1 ABC transporter permease [Massilia glaciei]
MFKLSLTMTLRDWRAGELRFLLAALALAVASLSSVHFFTERMGEGLRRDAHQSLGADLVVNTVAPSDAAWRDEAARRGLRSAGLVELTSMAIAGEGDDAVSKLVALKAVGVGYPLRGTLRLRQGALTAATSDIPAPGTAWVDARLLTELNLRPGDQIGLGDIRVTITRIIASEPDRGPAFMANAPRVMIGSADLAASALVQGGSYADHRLLVAGDTGAVAAYGAWLKTQLGGRAGVEVETLATKSASAGETLARAASFLSLVGLLSTMLAAVAVAMAARRFMLRHADACAMLRCLGLTQARVTLLYLIEFALIGLAASALGVLAGFAGHFVLIEWLGTLITSELAAPGAAPALRGLAIGMLLLVGFGMPPILQLRNVPHNLLLRRENSAPKALTLATYAMGLGVFVGVLLWQAGDVKLGLMTAAAFVLGLGLFAAVAFGAVASLKYARGALEHGAWRLALADLRRRPGATVTQVVALALGLMALLLLTMARGDLLAAWKNTAPADAPNHLVFKIQPGQRDAVAARMRAYGQPVLHPLILARLVANNGTPFDPAKLEHKRDKEMLRREIDVSATLLPASSTISAGHWFKAAATQPEVSVSRGFAKVFNLKLGDRLTLDVAGREVTAAITSLRKIEQKTRGADFSMILNAAAADGLPATYVTALHVPAAERGFADALSRDFPNLVVFDTGAMVALFQGVLDQVSAAIEFLFLFTLASGMLVLYVTLAASQDERIAQAALLRALGASRRQLARAQWIEYALIGALAGLLAAAGASAAGWALARFVFKLDWQLSPLLWLAGVLAGAVCALLGSWAGLRAVLNRPPLVSLRFN